jgi:hypothetical protein
MYQTATALLCRDHESFLPRSRGMGTQMKRIQRIFTDFQLDVDISCDENPKKIETFYFQGSSSTSQPY